MHLKLPFIATGHSILICLLAILILTACLPGEGDVAAKYNRINQRTAVENAAISLNQAAQAMTAYRVAAGMRIKGPLGDTMLTTLPSISDKDNLEPAPPVGVSVVPCGKFGALAYFNQSPKGLPPLTMVNSTMARTLADRFGGKNVGIKYPNGTIEMPLLTKDMDDCNVGGDILPGSPIMASGFQYKDDTLPDRRKVTWPSVDRAVTVKCPAGYEGVIKREKKCTLIFNEYEAEREKGEILIGGDKTPNPKSRMDKTWRCESNDAPPTADEILKFCRNPADGLTKPDDNAIEMNVDSLQQILSSTGPGYYTFKCRRTAADPTACEATPYTPTLPNTFLRCDKVNTPPLYVTNPAIPLTLEPSGNIIGNPAVNQSCGRGWTGKLTARYLVRRCNLYQTTDGAEILLKQSQTIYYIAYAAAQCSIRVRTQVQCPVGNLSGMLPIERDLIMLKPAALDWRPRIPGLVEWSTGKIATNDSRDEVKTEAAVNDPTHGKVPYIIADISQAELAASESNNTEWSLKLANALKRADEDSISMAIVPGSCNNDGEPCKQEAGGEITIVVDKSTANPLRLYSATGFTLPNLQCVDKTTFDPIPSNYCHPLLGSDQPKACKGNGICLKTGLPDYQVTGTNLADVLDSYLSIVTKPELLPPDVSVTIMPLSGTVFPMFNEESSACSLGQAQAFSYTMVFANSLTQGDQAINFECRNTKYTTLYSLIAASLNSFVSAGGQMKIYATSGYDASLWSVVSMGGPFNSNDLDVGGKVGSSLADWLKNPPTTRTGTFTGNPCTYLN